MKKPIVRPLFALVIATLAVAAPASSRVQTPPPAATGTPAEQAKVHVDRGLVFYNLQDFASAAREYKAAYLADPRAELLFMLAQAERQGGDCATAIGTYKAYARTPGVTPTQTAAAESLVHKCEAELADAQAKAAAAAAAAKPAPGPSAPALAQPAPKGAAPPKDDAAAPGPWYGDVLGGVLFVGGLGLAGVGTGLLVAGNASMSSAPSGATFGDYKDQSAGAKPKQAIGVGGIVAGATLATLGVVRYVLVASRKGPDEKAAWLGVEPRVGPGGASAAFVGRF
jgi:hypothetical protein